LTILLGIFLQTTIVLVLCPNCSSLQRSKISRI